MGGSDQWGNIVSGIDLGRRLHSAQFFALTSPLITTSSGAKMGKTAAGAVWLNADLVSPYEYWQYWRNTEDADVGRFLKLFTVLPLEEIARLAALKGEEINEAKKVLATEATRLVHGRTAAEEAAGTARTTFEEGGLGASLPTVDVPRAELEAGLGVLTAYASSAAGFVAIRTAKRGAPDTRNNGHQGQRQPTITDEEGFTIGDERRHGADGHGQALVRPKAARPAQAGLMASGSLAPV